MNQNILLSTVALVAALTTTACGAASHAGPKGEGGASAAVAADGAQSVTLKVGNSMSFTPSSLTVAADTPVALTLRNDGFIPHDFTLTGSDAPSAKVAAGMLTTGHGTFTFDRPGIYTFICSVEGHADAGMKGTITVQ